MQSSHMSTPQPILVTGMHRSGTTWAGKMLCAGGEATYVSEPLNPLRPAIRRLPVKHRYTYIHRGNEFEFLTAYQELIRLQPKPLAELANISAPRDVLRLGYSVAQFFAARLKRQRVLLKDPYAIFSAEWFADRMHCDVVILVRHPAAVVSSLKRLGWRAPLASLDAQPVLVRDWLEPFREALASAREEADRRRDLIWSNSLLWTIIYSAVADYAVRRNDFFIVKHEDLAKDPKGMYAGIYRNIGLRFNERAAAAVRASSRESNPTELDPDEPHSVRLNSRANLQNWRRRLTAAEVEAVRSITGPVARHWYGDRDWS
jgi:hypothetical protein